jgi:hypothetical protein
MKAPGSSSTESYSVSHDLIVRPRLRAASFLLIAMFFAGLSPLRASPDPVFIGWPAAITNGWQSTQVTFTNATYPNGLPVSNIAGPALVTIVSGTNGFDVIDHAGQNTVNGTNYILIHFTPGTNSAVTQSYTNTIQVALTNITGAPPFGGATTNIDIVITAPPVNRPVFTASFEDGWSAGSSTNVGTFGPRVSSPASNSPSQFPTADITNLTTVYALFLSNSLGQSNALQSRTIPGTNTTYLATSNGFGFLPPYATLPSKLLPSNPWSGANNLSSAIVAGGWYAGNSQWVGLTFVPGTNNMPVTNYVQLLAYNGNNISTANWTTNNVEIVVAPELTAPPALEVRFYNTSTNAASNVYIVPSSTDALGSYGNGFWWTNAQGASNNYTNWVNANGNVSLRLSDLGISGTNELGRPYYSVFTTNFPNAAWYISYGGGHVSFATWYSATNNRPAAKTGALWYGYEWGPFEVTLDGNAADKSDMTYINQFSIPVSVRALTNDFANSLVANYPTNSSAYLYQQCGFTNWASSTSVAASLSNLATQLSANFPFAKITNAGGTIVMYAGPSTAPAGSLVAPQLPPYTNGVTSNSFPLFAAYFDAFRTSGTPALIKDYISLGGTNNGGTNTYHFYYELTNTVTSSNKLRLHGKLYVSNAPGSAPFSTTYSNLSMEIGADAGVNDNWASWTVYTAPTPANFLDKYQNYNLSGATNGLFTNITAYSPAASNGLGGTAVSIVGTNLAGANMVFFAGPSNTLIPARHFTATNNTNITAYVPYGAVKGPIVVTRTNGGGGSGISDTNPANWFAVVGATNTTAFTGPVISNASSPVIDGFTPTSGPAASPVFTATGNWLAAANDTDTGPVNANPTPEDLFSSGFGASVMGRILGDMAAGFALGFINSSASNQVTGTNFGASPSGSWWGGNEFPAASTVSSNAYSDVNTNYSAWGQAIYASATKITYGHPIYDRMQFYGAGNPTSPLQIQPASGTNNVGPGDQLLPVWVVEVEFFNGLSSVGDAPPAPEYLTYSNWVAAWLLTGSNTNPTADPDNDGFDNNDEYAFGGNPTNPTPYLINISGSNISYIGLTNNTVPSPYTVQNTTNLATGPWTNYPTTVTNATNQLEIPLPTYYQRKEFTVPVTAGTNNFYRVIFSNQ